MNQSSAKHVPFDSGREHLGKIYAKGLLDAAEAQGLTEQILAEFDSVIEDVLDKLSELEQLLVSPRIGLEEKHRILDQMFCGRMTPLLLNFLKVVARHGRMDCLRPMRTAARHFYNERRGRVEVTVETADSLTSQVRSQIEQRLTAALGQQVALCCSVNPRLLGGLVVRVGDTVYDGSLENRLVRMRFEALHRTTQLIRDSLQQFLVSQ